MRFLLPGSLVLALIACNKDQEPADTGPTGFDLDAIVTTDRPSKRSEITAVGNESTNSILLFGGNAGPVSGQVISSDFQNDTWLFHPGTGWEKVDADNGPRKRGRYAIGADEAGERAFVFGGRYRELGGSGNYELFNDLWEFSFRDKTWTRLDNGEGTAPAPRYYPEGVYEPTSGRFFVFGGALNADPLSVQVAMDLWAWDGSGWAEIPTTGDIPSMRTYLATTLDTKRNRLVVFAGQSGDFVSCSYQDTYALDLETMVWEQLHDGEGKAPETRFHAHLQYDAQRDQYLMFGGHADVGAMNDLWAFDPTNNTWDKVHIADILRSNPNGQCDNAVSPGCNGNDFEVPKEFAKEDPTAPERRYRGMFVLMHDNLWLGEGINIECSDHLDDTWRYDIAGDTWHELVEARAGESCIRRGDDCDCMCI